MCIANAGWSWKLVVDCFPWVGSLLLTRGPMFVWCERFSSRCYLSWMWAKWVGKIRFAGSACVEWFDVSESLLCAKCAKLFAIAIMPKICWNVGLSDRSMSVCACAVYGEQYKNTLSPSIADSLQANAHTNALTNEKLLPVWKITNGKIDIANDFQIAWNAHKNNKIHFSVSTAKNSEPLCRVSSVLFAPQSPISLSVFNLFFPLLLDLHSHRQDANNMTNQKCERSEWQLLCVCVWCARTKTYQPVKSKSIMAGSQCDRIGWETKSVVEAVVCWLLPSFKCVL